MRAFATLLLPATLSLFLASRPALPAQENAPAAETGPRVLHNRLQSRRTPVVDIVVRVKGAVVNIHSERTAQAPAAQAETQAVAPSSRINGMGTGIIIDPRGYIVTN